MKRRHLILAGSICAVLVFGTGFIGLNHSNFKLPELGSSKEDTLSVPPLTTEADDSLQIADRKEEETAADDASPEEMTEASSETIPEGMTEASSETIPEEETTGNKKEEQTEVKAEVAPAFFVPAPSIDQQLLTENDWSRPGTKFKKIKQIVLHYSGNAGTTAQENRDYFESLKDSQDLSMSANYLIGLDGEIIQCVPDHEIAYATKDANKNSISIEYCHPDDTGKCYEETYLSLVKLTAYLSEQYDLDRTQILRHYDINGFECPAYFTENEDAWGIFLDDVMKYRSLCETKPKKARKLRTYLAGLDNTYSGKDEVNSQKESESEEIYNEDASDYYEDSYYDGSDYGYDYGYQESYYPTSYENDAILFQDTYSSWYDY